MTVVVIPYFQREAGILRRALASVAAQVDHPGPVTVIVVDDSSPAPAEPEIASVAWPTNVTISLLQQPNAGPGAARNTGLNAVPDGTDYVAFLDSDDCWRPQHLSRAIAALSSGADVYFSNFVQLGATSPAFERAGRLSNADLQPIDEARGLWAYTGDMLTQIVVGNLIGTPTVVFRAERFRPLRFRPQFRRAGEDYLFWMDMAARNARFCLGTFPMVDCGRGVNVYAGAGWGTDGQATRILDELAYREFSQREFTLLPQALAHVRAARRRLKKAFLADCMHRLRHRKPLDWSSVRVFLRMTLLPSDRR